MRRKNVWIMFLISALIFCWAVPGGAQDEKKYPEKPVQVLIPFAAGGETDIAIRLFANIMPKYLGKPLVPVNKPGASGTICFEAVAKSTKPDGYTIMGASIGSNSIAPAANLTLPFKYDDLTFIALTQKSPSLLVVRNESPFKTLNDLLNFMKQNPKKLTYSTVGAQTLQNLGILVLLKAAKVPMENVNAVHYESGGEANLALVRGDVDFLYNNSATTVPLVRGGKLRGLLAPLPLKELPDVPTSKQLGYPGVDIVGWRGIVGPPGLPDYVVNKWVDAIKKTMQDKAWIEKVTGAGDIPSYLGPADFKSFVASEVKKYREIFTEMNLLVK